jgi:hypothetical protein
MKKLFIVTILIVLAHTFLYGETLAAPPSNYHTIDAGTEANPFLISTLANLRWLSETINYWGDLSKHYYFRQTADINAYETRIWNDGRGFQPIGNADFREWLSGGRPFTGHYNGGGFTIDNLYIFNPISTLDFVNIGLFGSTIHSTIENVRLENIEYILTERLPGEPSTDAIGAIVGTSGVQMMTGDYLINISATGTITVNANTFDISVGGLVGDAWNSTIEKCFSTVSINVDDKASVGGLAGSLWASHLKNSYYMGLITHNRLLGSGGFLGSSIDSNVSFCYLTSPSKLISTDAFINHISAGSVNNCLWDMEMTGIVEIANALTPHPWFFDIYPTLKDNFGLPTSAMKSPSTFTSTGWDFAKTWAINPNVNNGYPYLVANPPRTNYFPPVNLSGNRSISAVSLSWDEPMIRNGELVSYKIYRNGVLIDTQGFMDTNYIDTNPPNGTHFYYITAVYDVESALIESVASNVIEINTTTNEKDIVITATANLLGNFPNPFNPQTTIKFEIGNGLLENVSVDIFNIRGQHVRTLVNGVYGAGSYSVIWNGMDDSGRAVGSGIYFYRMTTNEYSAVLKMILMK